ncbi:MAG: hypothetical protein M1825_006463 [Sarcosagium campestre]|nr:MAG: hypothetical protein M1825_006463 [Sarcosagium campestre]
MEPDADAIARVVIDKYNEMPPKRKPQARPGGKEWTILSGIVLSRGGDASMELIVAAQDDPTPWPYFPQDAESDHFIEPLTGRAFFSRLGVVRRKPSLKQCTSLLSSSTSLLVCPEEAYLHSVVVHSSQYCDDACKRAFGPEGRLKPIAGRQWAGGYSHHSFAVRSTGLDFDDSKRTSAACRQKTFPSNLSCIWTPHLEESCINGVLQGRKQEDPKGASRICKWSIWVAVGECLGMIDDAALAVLTKASETTYDAIQQSQFLAVRRGVKDEVRTRALLGWTRNGGNDFLL